MLLCLLSIGSDIFSLQATLTAMMSEPLAAAAADDDDERVMQAVRGAHGEHGGN